MVVFGAGYIGVEFACIFHRLGSEVHMVYRQALPLGGFDGEVRACSGVAADLTCMPTTVGDAGSGFRI